MIELPSLYQHQEVLRDRTREALSRRGRVVLTAPPGMGKTRMAKWILGASANREPNENQTGRSVFAVHRRGLVDNASNSFNEEPELDHGVVMSGEKTDWGARIQVASIDTLLSWFVKDGEYDTNVTFDLVVFDETHSHIQKLSKFLQHHDKMREEQGKHPAFVIGLTATPQAKGMADIYSEIVNGPSTQWLTDNKFLAPFRYFRATQGRLELLKKSSTGDFTKQSEESAMEGMAGDLVRDWKKFAQGRPTVGFFPRRTHAQDAKVLLRAAGIKTEYIDGETGDSERERIFWLLREGRIDYLCNVQVVERGTDIPAIGCIQLCVAIGSLVRYRQMIGRGSRVHPDKEDCVVLDHGGNVMRHGLFSDDPHWSLDQSTNNIGEVVERPMVECPECSAIYRGGKCSSCGYEPTKKELKAQGLVFDGEEMREITKNPKKERKVTSADDLMVSSMYIAGKRGLIWRQAVGLFKGLNKKQGTNYRVPKTVTVYGHRYRTLRYQELGGEQRVADLFPFTNDRGNHGGKYHLGKD